MPAKRNLKEIEEQRASSIRSPANFAEGWPRSAPANRQRCRRGQDLIVRGASNLLEDIEGKAICSACEPCSTISNAKMI